VHVPAGAIPKDGPSAGIAIMSAVASVALDRSVPERHRDDRRGGGIKEKVLAAKRKAVTRERPILKPAR
jgi:ATP-dependent Lon protease